MKSFQDLCHQSENLGRFEQINVYTIESDIYISKLYYEDDQEDLIFFRIYPNILKSRFIKNSAVYEQD